MGEFEVENKDLNMGKKEYYENKEEATVGKLVELYVRRNELDVEIFKVKEELQKIWNMQKSLEKSEDEMDR